MAGVAAALRLTAPPVARVQVEVTDPRWGTYRQRGQALGIPILAFDCVCQEAVATAAHIIQSMLADADGSVVRAMVESGAEVAVIGRNQARSRLGRGSIVLSPPRVARAHAGQPVCPQSILG